MAQTTREQRASYPLAAYNFRVTVGGSSIGFAEVSGLKVQHESVSYRHGLSFREGEELATYPQDKYAPLTLRKGRAVGAAFLYDWLKSRERRALEVSLCDEQGRPVLSWVAARAVPVKLEASALTAAGNEVFIETLEVMASGISVKDHAL
jgi:phage tail-like protein